MKIGEYKVEKINSEEFIVVKDYSQNDYEHSQTVKICGGDFETLLSTLFIRPEITYKLGDYVKRTTLEEVTITNIKQD